MILLYSITFAISLLMLPAYFLIDKKRNSWLLMLILFVLISNTGYFAAIVVIICYATIKKTAVSTKHTTLLAIVLLGNIALGLWKT